VLGLAQLCHWDLHAALAVQILPENSISTQRMRSLLTLVPVDKFLYVEEQVIEIAILVGVDFFSLQGFQKAFATCVVVRIRREEACALR
jgi:hypothetical protein